MIGYINSFQSLGTVDGPGIRFVIFMQGCNLRCSCCHNPETWAMKKSKGYSIDEVFNKILKYKDYFSAKGGVTVSGGEPLLQADFLVGLFQRCREAGIHTCLDTSGSIINTSVETLLNLTDLVLLDIKYTNEEDYTRYTGGSLTTTLSFLELLKAKGVNTIIRQVIIPTINDSPTDILKLKEILNGYTNIINIELLPFKKLCLHKYSELGIEFKFKNIPVLTVDKLNKLKSLLD